ncbi:MAG: polysaccharide deacetylase family protein [Rhodothermales bacterium]|nr:polysaccharide deacetylase family protein [Rhodothermales bacterium]
MSLKYLWLNIPPRIASTFSPVVVSRVPNHENKIFLTFDDGPTDATKHLLTYLESMSIVSTFFWTGSNVASFDTDGDGSRLASSVTIGNHFNDHRDPWTMRRKAMQESISEAATAITSKTGVVPKTVRPPYGHVTPGLVSMARANGLRVILWDVMAGDFMDGIDVEVMVAECCKRIQSGSIVVLHDHGIRHFEDVLIPFISRLNTRIVEAGFSFSAL